MYKVIQTANPEKVKEFATEQDATAFVKRQRKAKSFYTIVFEPDIKHKQHRVAWKLNTDFTDAVEVTRNNVKQFYNKAGYIKVVDKDGHQLHIGKTKNMGKVFSNYINCANYKQSYDFNLEGTDKLLFKEAII